MSGTSLIIKGETILLEEATLNIDDGTITCRYTERLVNACHGWLPIEVEILLKPCKFPIVLRVIDVTHMQESDVMLIEFDGPVISEG
jgi:hypothetical protein